MRPGRKALSIYRGTTFRLRVQWSSVSDWTGWEPRVQIRERVASPEAVLELTLGSGITIDGDALVLAISAADTAALGFDSGYWSLEVSQGDDTYRLLEGPVRVDQEVTR